ncbi:ARID/BRIGHT DNA binding domain protein, partial [Teladorsagia circumcincta]
MERRKRKSALANYLNNLSDPPEKLKKISDFYHNLRQFYKRKWNAPLKLPTVQGVEVNLFRLYDTVMALGGWQKVALHEKWSDVAEMLGIGEDVIGGDHAIKLLYMRYLSKYEQIETIGDLDDMLDGEMSRSRGRQSSFFATNDCPVGMGRNHEDQDISDLATVWHSNGGRDFTTFWASAGIPEDLLEKFAPHVVGKKVDSDGDIFTGLVKEFDVRDPMSWRINQIDLTWHKMVHCSDHALLRIVKEGIFSNDKFKLIRSMEILTALSSFEGNESTICDFLDSKMFEHIFNVVCIKDIMMCVYTLECLYQPRVLYSGGTQIAGPPQQMRHIVQQQHQQQHSQHVPAHIQQTPHHHVAVASSTPRTHFTPAPQTGASVLPSSGGGENKVDQLTEQWIRQNCVLDRSAVTPRGELYAAYVDDLRNQYHSLSGSLAMFSNVMKSIFPELVFKMADNGLMMVAQGIRLVKPHRLAPAASAQVVNSGAPINTNPTPPAMVPVAPTPQPPPHSATIAAHPLMKQILTKNAQASLPVVNGINGVAASNPSSRSASPAVDVNTERKEESPAKHIDVKPSQDSESKTNGQNVKTENGVTTSDDEPCEDDKASRRKESETRSQSVLKSLIDPLAEYMCEWDGCAALFATAPAVLSHVARRHIIDDCEQACQWPGCDGTLRSRWSLVTHVQDHHANETALKMALQRRKDGLAPAQPHRYRQELPREVPHHPGYSKHAAIEAIRRHAFNFLPRDIT